MDININVSSEKVDLMKVYFSGDPDAKEILEKVSRFTQQTQAMNLPYWVVVYETDPMGIVAVEKEPIQLYAPPGTPMALLRLINPSLPAEVIEEFIFGSEDTYDRE
jgi:hypothetical protein